MLRVSGDDDEEPPPAPVVDASIDKSEGGAGPGSDAAVEAATDAPLVPCNQTTPIIDEAFAGTLEMNWNPQVISACSPGNIGIETDAGSLYAVSRCNATAIEGYAVLNGKTLHAITRGELTFKFRVTGEKHSFAQLADFFGSTGDNLTMNGAPEGFELRRKVTSAIVAQWPNDAGIVDWHVLRFTFEPAPSGQGFQVKATLDGTGEQSFFTLHDVDAAAATVLKFALQLGVYATSSVGSFESHYDDVRLWSCP